MEERLNRIIFIRRVLELLITEIVLSLIITILNVVGILTIRYKLFFAILLCIAAFVFINVFTMRSCFYDLRDRKLHYNLNFGAYFVFFAVNMLSYVILPNEVYTCLFSVTKVLRYALPQATNVTSALAFHAVGVLTVLMAPLGMGWVFDEEYE